MSDPLKEPGVARTPDVTIELLKENERLTAALEERVKDVMPASAQLLNITKAALDNAEAENERLRDLAADLMELVDGMPIRHPQQATRRDILRGQCRQFGALGDKTDAE